MKKKGCLTSKFVWLVAASALLVASGSRALAQTSTYPTIRYLSPASQSMGGVSLPLANEIGNSLFNNPAGLAKNEMFRAEYLNLDGDLGGNTFGAFGQNMTTLSGLKDNLNSHQNTTLTEGYSDLTAFSWGGFGAGVLIQNRVRAYSDGTNIHYQTLNDFVPAVGYGLSLARGVVKIGYSLQYINEASGVSQTAATNSSASFMSGLAEGHAFSNNASVMFTLPMMYLPTFTLIARNMGGLHFTSGAMFTRASSVSGTPADEAGSYDGSFSFMVRLSPTVRTNWCAEFDDISGTTSIPFMERLRLGTELMFNHTFSIRLGTTGGQFSGGIGYHSESNEINVAMYQDRSPFSSVSYWDTRYALQYKVFFQNHNTRDRDAENKGPQ